MTQGEGYQGGGCFPIKKATSWNQALWQQCGKELNFPVQSLVSESPSRFLQGAVCGLQGGSWGKHGLLLPLAAWDKSKEPLFLPFRNSCWEATTFLLAFPSPISVLDVLAVDSPLLSRSSVGGWRPARGLCSYRTRSALTPPPHNPLSSPPSMGREGFKPKFIHPQ